MTLREQTEVTVSALSVLSDEVRRNLYFHVRAAAHPISRDEAAELAGISRNLAAFHLEKLVAASLLDICQPRLPRLPRPGRTPKLYGVAQTQITLSLPPRRYETFAGMLLEAVRIGGDPVRVAAASAARNRGTAIGAAALQGARVGRLGLERAVALARRVLETEGYEPETSRTGDEVLLLRNCPFHALRAENTALVCALNCELVAGVLGGLGADVLEARLAPREEHCCVTVAARARPDD